MSFREWIEALEDRIQGGATSVGECWDTLKSNWRAAFKNPLFHAWLGVIAAVASAFATGFSYVAAEKAVEVSSKAQAFAERTSQEQIALTRPILSVMGGRLISWGEDVGPDHRTVYRLELVIRNSGGRSALPAWIGLFKWDADFARQRTSNWMPEPIAIQISEIPSSAERVVLFDLGSSWSAPTDWMLGLAYGDDVPDASRKSEEQRLRKRCSSAKVIWLHASKSAEAIAKGPLEMTVMSATPMIVDLTKVRDSGPTELEAIAVQMERTLAADGRCPAS